MSVRISAERTLCAAASKRLLTPRQAREVRLSMEGHTTAARRLGVSTKLVEECRAGRTYGQLRPDEAAARQRRANRPAERPSEYDNPLGTLVIVDAPYVGALDVQDRQEQLDAAHECAHGRLPHDPTLPCGCWPQERDPTGVTWFPKADKWRVRVSINGTEHYLGLFDTQEAAGEAAIAFRTQHQKTNPTKQEVAQ